METRLSETLETNSVAQENLDNSSPSLQKETLDGRCLVSLPSDPNGSSPISATAPDRSKILDESSPPIDSSMEKTETPDDNRLALVHCGPLPRNHPLNLNGSLETAKTQEKQPLNGIEEVQNEEEKEEFCSDMKPGSPCRRYRWGSWSRQSHSPSQSEKQWPIQIKSTGVGAGLENLGNTCFMNAILQCFTHAVPLVQGLRSCIHAEPCHGATEGFCVICAIRDHIELSLASSGKVVSPWKLVDNLNNISSFFERYQQEDAHEFLQCFLDRLETCCLESMKKEGVSSQEVNLVDKIFGGRLISKLRCCNCGNCSDTYEPLIDLSLEIEDVDSLECALESFTKLEKIEDPETKFTCENCKEQVSVEKQLMLDKAPLIAAFHLKRFKTDGSYVVKIDKHVQFPLELDLQPYTNDGQKSDVELKYHLYAIVEHTGSLPTCGHYFSYIRSSPDTWHRLNDSRVTMVESEFVLSQDAYILFYAKQGTPWISSLLEVEKLCVDADNSNSSPKSVLDNVDSDYTSYSGVANAENCEADEPRDSAGGSSTKFSGKLRSEDVEVNATRDTERGISTSFTSPSRPNATELESRDDTPMIDASRPVRDSDYHGISCSEKVNKLSSFEDNNGNQGSKKVIINDGFCHLTPPRSPSPDPYSGKPTETYNAPLEHLKLDRVELENKVNCKKQLGRDEKDLERQEAIRCIKKTMPGARGLKLMAAINDGSLNKRRLKSTPCKRVSPLRARRKHNHGLVMRRVTI